MKRKLIFIFIIFFNVWFFVSVFAQTERKENFFTSFGVGARAYVLKASFVSIANDYAATHWNPAGVAFLNKMQGGAMHSKLSFERQIGFISFILPLDQSNKIGVSWKGLLINSIPGRTSNTLTPDYLFNNIEQVFVLTYSRKIFYNFGLGINLDFLHQSLNNINAGGWGLDFGLMYQVNRSTKVGFVLYDYHTFLKWATGHTDYFKKVGRLACSYQLNTNSLLAIGIEGKNHLSASSEFRLMKPLVMRMGWQDKFLSMGMGFNFHLSNLKLNLNYAVTNHRLTDQLSHIFDLNIVVQAKRRIRLATIKTNKLNVRSGPGFSYKKIGVVKNGQSFLVLANKSKWIKIKYAGKKTGWIKKDYAVMRTS
jgi:hypothetical protein